MVDVKSANAMAEVIYYLKGIRQEDINKIPKNLFQYINDNASKEYKCDFDYTKPLKELNLLDETRGIIGMICYYYWCINESQKKQYIDKLNANELKYEEILRKKYNPDNLFKNKDEKIIEDNVLTTEIIEYKENILKKIIIKIKRFFHR